MTPRNGIWLTRRELEPILGALPQCRESRSSRGFAKRELPTQRLADVVASWHPGSVVYLCKEGSHYHVASGGRPPDRVSDPLRLWPSRRAETWQRLMDHARERAQRLRCRQHVYGTRNEAGRWVWRVHFAEYRDEVRPDARPAGEKQSPIGYDVTGGAPRVDPPARSSEVRAYGCTEVDGWVIADQGGWLPGRYDAEATARRAVTLDPVKLQAVCDAAAGDVITMADLPPREKKEVLNNERQPQA